MPGRGRARARGRGRGEEAAAPPAHAQGDAGASSAVTPSYQMAQPPPLASQLGVESASDLIGRGRQKATMPSSRKPVTDVSLVSAGMEGLMVVDRGGRRRGQMQAMDVGLMTRQTMEHVRQSKTGERLSGQPVKLLTNYFKLMSRKMWMVYQYHVTFSPELESKRLRIALLHEHNELLGETRAFDGCILYLPKKLEKVSEVWSKTRQEQKIKITITLTNELPPSSPTAIVLFNIIFRKVLKMVNMQQIGRNYYNPDDAFTIPQHRLHVWPGFVTSIMCYESDVMLCADVSHKILRNESVLDFMYTLFEQIEERHFHDACQKELVGQVILTRYNNRTYRIDDISWNRNPSMTFLKSDGTEVTYYEYYTKHYSLEVKDMQQPLLISRSKRKDSVGKTVEIELHLLPEISYLTGLSDKMRSDFHLMKDLGLQTQVGPDKRAMTTQKFIEKLQSNPETCNEFAKWGLSFDRQLLSLTGRVVPCEKLYQKDQSYQYNQRQADWSRESRNMKLMTPISLEEWMLLFTHNNSNEARAIVDNLMQVGPPMGMHINKPEMFEVLDRAQSFVQTLQQNLNHHTQMVMCVLPTIHKGKYDSIKQFLCVERPFPSQCVLARTLSKPQMIRSVATKIALQMNCKLGGELWSVEIPIKQLMVVGVDSYHDSITRGQSVCGFVASLNQTLTRWYSRCIFQHAAQEMIDGLKVCMQCKNFISLQIASHSNDVMINVVIIYFLSFLNSYCCGSRPKVTVVVVKKRGIARFFEFGRSGLQNPSPGTVIDTEATRHEWYDFYLVSQSVRQGTVTPTHYNVVYDTSNMKPDHMQRLAYKMCHLYYNWPGVIRVPAPCHYAHKLAFLVGQSIHKEPSLDLSDRLYYL
uniref:Piwi-like RNA-mediated gene silencing 1 n=1 Tax=Petromyzon marinus TaxID=7757 RepID=S4RYE2_PETMA